MVDPYALTHVFASHVVDGADDVPRKVVAPVFKVQKHPACRFILKESGIGRGWCNCWWQGGRVLAEFKICLQNEAPHVVVFPPSCDVAPVKKARNVNVVLLHGVLEFVGAEEALYTMPSIIFGG